MITLIRLGELRVGDKVYREDPSLGETSGETRISQIMTDSGTIADFTDLVTITDETDQFDVVFADELRQ